MEFSSKSLYLSHFFTYYIDSSTISMLTKGKFLVCHLITHIYPMSCRYIGLPPSWSMTLASAGFTPEEIADIQARRAAGSLAPDLRYLYTERPTSPQVAEFQPSLNTEGPLLSKPASRSDSLPLTESPRPPLMLNTSSSITPRPPPNRKPPLLAEDLQNGSKPNQSSSSATLQRGDSLQAP